MAGMATIPGTFVSVFSSEKGWYFTAEIIVGNTIHTATSTKRKNFRGHDWEFSPPVGLNGYEACCLLNMDRLAVALGPIRFDSSRTVLEVGVAAFGYSDCVTARLSPKGRWIVELDRMKGLGYDNEQVSAVRMAIRDEAKTAA